MSNELTIEKLRHYAATEIMGMELCGNYYRVNKSTYVFSVHPYPYATLKLTTWQPDKDLNQLGEVVE